MSPILLLVFVCGYFLLLLAVAWLSSRNAGNEAFFIGNRRSNWMLVAFGMIGTSLSGVTFISVPGAVGAEGFGYFQIILGQFAGYMVIAFVLLPVYYRLRLTSIYDYLRIRLGREAHKTGAGFFILSRTLGATARLYLVVNILQVAVIDPLTASGNGWSMPFWLSATLILAMILAYTWQGGVKTIVWTDTLQTLCMLAGLIICVAFLLDRLDLTLAQGLWRLDRAGLSTVFTTDPDSRQFWAKQLLAGMFVAIAMTGMDQEMMQKTISVQRLADAQKNIVCLSLVMIAVVLLFLFLGGLLSLYAPLAGIGARGDALFPAVVMTQMPAMLQVIFVIALISALFPSADGAITALTASFCIDILEIDHMGGPGNPRSDASRQRLRKRVHLGFALLFLLLVMAFKWADSASMISVILKLAGYTYGPLLGLFAFGILTRRALHGRRVPAVALAAPLLCWAIDQNQEVLFGAYRIGLELLVINAALTFVGLWLISLPAGSRPDRAQAAEIDSDKPRVRVSKSP